MVQEFIKAKLSRKAIDDIAIRNMDTTSPHTFLYTLADGQRIPVSPYKIIRGPGTDELNYLLGQTYPYHHHDSYKTDSFPVTDLIFDKDRKPWGAPNDATSLFLLAMNSRTLLVARTSRVPRGLFAGLIKPVIHQEGSELGY